MRRRAAPGIAPVVLLLTIVLAGPAAAQSSAPNPAPAANPASAAQVPAWVTGTLRLAGDCVEARVEAADGLLRERGWRCAPQEWVTSDPRLSGTSTNTWNADVWVIDGALISLRRGTYDVINDQGSWHCEFAHNLAHGSGLFFDPDHSESVTCVGAGDYEGLTAIVTLDWSDFQNVTLVALIVPGDPPPLP